MGGIWMGVSAAVIGLLCGIAMIRVIYRDIPLNDFLVIGAIGIIPILIAVIGSILPARMAMHMSPMSGISGGYFNEKVYRLFLDDIMACFNLLSKVMIK